MANKAKPIFKAVDKQGKLDEATYGYCAARREFAADGGAGRHGAGQCCILDSAGGSGRLRRG